MGAIKIRLIWHRLKVKFRPSTVSGREGTLYYQIIHNRVVRQINTEYKLFVSEWTAIPKRLSYIICTRTREE